MHIPQSTNHAAASACIWWAGESLLDLSPYIDDARSLQLMLLGGSTWITPSPGWHGCSAQG